MTMTLFDLQKIGECGRHGCVCMKGKIVHCPVPGHPDNNPSLSISEVNGKILFKCQSRCSQEEVMAVLKDMGLWGKEPEDKPRDDGVTVESYLNSKRLDQVSAGREGYHDIKTIYELEDVIHKGKPAIKFTYDCLDDNSNIISQTRYRVSLNGRNKFEWAHGSKPMLYGLERLWSFYGGPNSGVWTLGKEYCHLVEGESDVQTLWGIFDEPVLGLPGATMWNEERDYPCFNDVEIVYVHVEPDAGGEAVLKSLGQSRLRAKAKLIFHHKDFKDINEVWQECVRRYADVGLQHEKFREELQRLMDQTARSPMGD